MPHTRLSSDAGVAVMHTLLSHLRPCDRNALRAFYCDEVTPESAANIAGLSLERFSALRRSIRTQYQEALAAAGSEIAVAVAATAGGAR
jgi:hypothetical protein